MRLFTSKLFLIFSFCLCFLLICGSVFSQTLTVDPSVNITGCNAATNNSFTFSVGGSGLTGNVTITTITNTQISQNGTTYGSSLVITPVSGNISNLIFIRVSASAPAGSFTGNISVSSAGATTQNVSVSATVNQTPALTIGTVAPIFANSTSFSIPFTYTGTPDHFSVTPGTSNALPGFSTYSQVIPSGNIDVPINASPQGTYNFKLQLTGACKSLVKPFSVQIQPTPPTVSTNVSSLVFQGCSGSTSNPFKSLQVKGFNLTSDELVSAPTGLELSIDNVTYSPTLSIANTGGTVNQDVFVRASSSAPVGPITGNINVSATGATDVDVASSGNVAAVPVLTTGLLNDINVGATSFDIPYTLTGSANQYDISVGNRILSGFNAVSAQGLGANKITVPLPASYSAGTYDFNVSVYGTCLAEIKPVVLKVLGPVALTTDVNSLQVMGCKADLRRSFIFNLSGSNLTSNVTIDAPSNTEISTDNTIFSPSLILNATLGNVAQQIYLRPTAEAPLGTVFGSVIISASGISPKLLTLTGSNQDRPILTVYPVTDIDTKSSSFKLDYSISGNADHYSISTVGPNPLPGFTKITNFVAAGTLTIPISTTTAGNYNFIINVNGSCTSLDIPFTLKVLTPPTVTFATTSINLNGCSGYNIKSQPVRFSCNDFTSPLTITAPVGIVLYNKGDNVLSGTLSYSPINGNIDTVIYIQYDNSTLVGPFSGNIHFASNGVSKDLAISGNVYEVPELTIGSINNVNTNSNYFDFAFSSTGNPNKFELFSVPGNPMPDFTNILDNPISANPIKVQIPKSAIGTYNFTAIVKTSTGCESIYKDFILKVISPSAPILNSFTPTVASRGQTIDIHGSSFTGASSVMIGGVAATTFTVVSDNEITAEVPHTSDGDVTVVTGLGTINKSAFQYASTLPLSFVFAKTFVNNNVVTLQWKIADLQEVEYFIIERSADGSTYSTIQEIPISNSDVYNWIDNSPLSGNCFYRIKMLGMNSQTFVYSAILNVSLKGEGIISVFPNPIINRVFVLNVSGIASGIYQVNILNDEGKIVYREAIYYSNGIAQYKILLPKSLPSGVYTIDINKGNEFKKAIPIIIANK